ncbi:DNA-directed DNA polymerase [Tanacetum coccineum]
MIVEELVEVEKEAKVDYVMDIVVDTKENDKVKQEIVVFTKVPYRVYDESFMRFSTPCKVEGNKAMDTELNMAYFDNYMSKELLNDLGYVRLDYGEPSIVFGRSFLVTTKSQVVFGLREIKINITMLRENKDVDALLENLLKNMVKVNDASREQLDEVLMGRAKLKNKDHTEEDQDRILENGLPKKICDPENFVLLVSVNGTTSLSALADTGASVSVLPYTLYMNLGLGNPHPYHSNLTIANNTQAKAMGELPFLLGHPFLRTCGAMIDMRRGTMTIDDRVIKHTYYPQPRTQAYLENFKSDESEDWMSLFKVGRDQDGNPQYRPIAPPFLDIKDEMEIALTMEAYFNPLKNIIIFKNLINFLGSLPVALKNNDWGSKGYEAYKKIEGDGAWHAKF